MQRDQVATDEFVFEGNPYEHHRPSLRNDYQLPLIHFAPSDTEDEDSSSFKIALTDDNTSDADMSANANIHEYVEAMPKTVGRGSTRLTSHRQNKTARSSGLTPRSRSSDTVVIKGEPISVEPDSTGKFKRKGKSMGVTRSWSGTRAPTKVTKTSNSVPQGGPRKTAVFLRPEVEIAQSRETRLSQKRVSASAIPRGHHIARAPNIMPSHPANEADFSNAESPHASRYPILNTGSEIEVVKNEAGTFTQKRESSTARRGRSTTKLAEVVFSEDDISLPRDASGKFVRKGTSLSLPKRPALQTPMRLLRSASMFTGAGFTSTADGTQSRNTVVVNGISRTVEHDGPGKLKRKTRNPICPDTIELCNPRRRNSVDWLLAQSQPWNTGGNHSSWSTAMMSDETTSVESDSKRKFQGSGGLDSEKPSNLRRTSSDDMFPVDTKTSNRPKRRNSLDLLLALNARSQHDYNAPHESRFIPSNKRKRSEAIPEANRGTRQTSRRSLDGQLMTKSGLGSTPGKQSRASMPRAKSTKLEFNLRDESRRLPDHDEALMSQVTPVARQRRASNPECTRTTTTHQRNAKGQIIRRSASNDRREAVLLVPTALNNAKVEREVKGNFKYLGRDIASEAAARTTSAESTASRSPNTMLYQDLEPMRVSISKEHVDETIENTQPLSFKVRKKAPTKSPHFAPQTPIKTQRFVDVLDTPQKILEVVPSEICSPKKRSPARTVSCIPFPPLDASHFGLIQEKLAHDPFRLLIAVTFLIRTHGKHAIPVFFELMDKYPTPQSLVDAEYEDIVPIIKHLGLQHQRAATYQTYAKIWIEHPPVKGKRYRVLGYPNKGSGRDVKRGEVLDDDDSRDAWEIGHMTNGPYAIDSWRIFCRDILRGVAEGWNGEGAEGEGFQPEWMRVLPADKELRAYLRWMWLKEGMHWDPHTGDKEVAGDELQRAALEGLIAWDDIGGMKILERSRLLNQA